MKSLSFAKKYSSKELNAEIKLVKKNIASAEKEVAYHKWELAELNRFLREKLGEKANFERETSVLLKAPKPRSSVARWELFKKIVHRHTANRTWKPRIYMDRMPDGRLSVKIGDGNEFPKAVESVLRGLADSWRVYNVFDYAGYMASNPTHRGTRFYFNNIPGKSKYAKAA